MKREIPHPLNRAPKTQHELKKSVNMYVRTGHEMCQLRLIFQAIIKIKFYHRNMDTGHRVDIVHTALHMRRIPKQKLIKQYKNYPSTINNIIKCNQKRNYVK